MTLLFGSVKRMFRNSERWIRTVVCELNCGRSIRVADHPRAHYGQTRVN